LIYYYIFTFCKDNLITHSDKLRRSS